MRKLIWIIALFCASCVSNEIQDEKSKMVLVEGGTLVFGDTTGKENETPSVSVIMPSFYLDEHEVTNADFKAFVEAEDYVTTAEKNGESSVYSDRWKLERGVYWRTGEDEFDNFESLPVAHVSWSDANAYCKWKKKRLPTEMELEYVLETYGGGAYNIWEGTFPDQNEMIDGFKYAAPVKSFEPNEIGIYDLQGNLWEWTTDHYHYNVHDILVVKDLDSAISWDGAYYDPLNPQSDLPQKVIKGGSFLCNDSYCSGYRSNARMPADATSSYFHVGFRCACDE